VASAYASIGLALAFLALLVLLHFLKRELDPSWRMISEYAIGRFGWMMRLAFFCWGGSVLALVLAVSPSLVSLSGAISRSWFVVIAIALFGAGIFKTDPITDLTGSWVNRLHQVCGTIVIFTFPIAATIVRSNLLQGPDWSAYRLALTLGTTLTWVGLITFFGAIVVARVRDPAAGTPDSPHVKQGWPNRFLVVTYIIWIILVASTALRA
jgi:hypothetical protein